ncbi:DMT family transporter [Oceanomicrobium pacificus]|uniref:EamA family transporter n=1 Tax=Oceanomicrobium pacificus TaxID=2692916 RepID=A0A6B0THT8_9RHOB|nr:DMT family transporter [Oceanomicrobium pacificus]MXU63977.1 EamA family transporter [Oceanomicrobium pacificus]
MSTPRQNNPLAGIGLAVAAFGLFATHDAIVKFLGAGYSTFQIVFFSVLFGFVPVALMMTADRAVDNFRPANPFWVFLRTGISVVTMSAAFYAFTVLPLAETYAILFATPLLITALSVPMLGETVRARRWIAVLVGLAGVVIVLRPGYSEFSLGHLAALVAAIGSAVASVIVRKVGATERSAVLILFPMFANIICMGAILPFVYEPMPLGDLGLMAAIGGLAFIAQVSIIAAYKAASAALVAPMQYSQMLWATAYGALFFAEQPDRWVGVGAAIIILSGLYIVWRESRDNVSTQRPVLRMSNLRYDTGPSPKPKQGQQGADGQDLGATAPDAEPKSK